MEGNTWIPNNTHEKLRDSNWLKAGAIFNVRRVQSSNTSANYKLRVQSKFCLS